jgi:hypothetical protein
MRSPPTLLLFAVLFEGACSDGVQADTGRDAYFQVPGAQFFRGPMPQGSASGPAVEQLSLVNNNIWPGLSNDPIEGALGPTATAAAIGLQNDVGYWVVVAGVPAYTTPTYPSFGANGVFSMGIVPGKYTLVVRGVDASGNFGLPAKQILVAEQNPLNPPATGDLVVTLTWDTESNLDLHVVDPAGVDIYWGNQSDEPPPPAGPADGGSYGYVDYDSNANCVIDGLRREDAIWPDEPPSGQYTVRVDTPTLCGQPIANWQVKVVLRGRTIAESSGVSVDADTLGTHGTGSGQLALQFSVP